MLKSLSGCGCGLLVAVLLIGAFFAGARYGQQVQREVTVRGQKVMAQARAGLTAVNQQLNKAQAAADALAEPRVTTNDDRQKK